MSITVLGFYLPRLFSPFEVQFVFVNILRSHGNMFYSSPNALGADSAQENASQLDNIPLHPATSLDLPQLASQPGTTPQVAQFAKVPQQPIQSPTSPLEQSASPKLSSVLSLSDTMGLSNPFKGSSPGW